MAAVTAVEVVARTAAAAVLGVVADFTMAASGAPVPMMVVGFTVGADIAVEASLVVREGIAAAGERVRCIEMDSDGRGETRRQVAG